MEALEAMHIGFLLCQGGSTLLTHDGAQWRLVH